MPVKKIAISLTLILVLVGGFIAGLLLIRQQQDIREEASSPTGQATVNLLPSTHTTEVGETFQSSIYFNTNNIPISKVWVKLTYPYTGTVPEVTASNIVLNPSLMSTGDWSCPTEEVTEEGGVVSITIQCANINSEGYRTFSDTLLATFNLTVDSEPTINPVVISFDRVDSVISHKLSGQDILAIPSSVGSYSVGEAPVATLTPTTAAASPTPTTAAASPTPTTASTTVTPTPTELLDSGISNPTLIGIGLGLLAIFGSVAIAF